MPNIKVLYAEDEPFLGKIVKESLESRQFDICLIEDGAAVVAAFDTFAPDICVLDVMLPGRDGFSIGKEIRGKSPEIPIIYLTAKNQTTDVVTGFQSGGNDYIRKPFSMEELIVRIHNLLNIKGMAGPSAMAEVSKIGEYTFHQAKQTLTRGDQTAQLSYRECQLLQLLLHRPQDTVERKNILTEIWGHDSVFNSRNLDVYITRLRERFRDDPNVQILTLKGVGYRLVW